MTWEMTRRNFLLSQIVAGASMLVPLSSVGKVGDAGRAVLVAAVRTLFPHDSPADELYTRVIEGLEQCCRSDRRTAAIMNDGIRSLQWASLGRFAAADERTRIIILRAMSGQPFFDLLYSQSLETLYGRADMWELLATG
jgi:hypothetical protein